MAVSNAMKEAIYLNQVTENQVTGGLVQTRFTTRALLSPVSHRNVTYASTHWELQTLPARRSVDIISNGMYRWTNRSQWIAVFLTALEPR